MCYYESMYFLKKLMHDLALKRNRVFTVLHHQWEQTLTGDHNCIHGLFPLMRVSYGELLGRTLAHP